MSVEIKKFKINTLLNRYPYLPASNVQNELSSFNHFSVPKIASELQLSGLNRLGWGTPNFQDRRAAVLQLYLRVYMRQMWVGNMKVRTYILQKKDSTLKIIYQFQLISIPTYIIPFAINKISSPLLVLLEDLLCKINVHLSIRVR